LGYNLAIMPLKDTIKKTAKKARDLSWGYSSIKLATSLSDNQKYPDFCYRASLNSKTFNRFRRSRIYQEILERSTYTDGKKYIEEINKLPDLWKSLEQFKANDDWGSPALYDYPLTGKISPSTLLYIKVYGDLVKLFGSLNSLNIVEIGVGYGGQCRIINAASAPSGYTLLDIKPALMLAQTYLDKYPLKSTVSFKVMNELEAKDFDLVISNYAFTELPRSIQQPYLDKVILKSKRGYITFNDINPANFNSYKLDELLSIIPGSKVIPEVPLTHKNNCIIVWGTV
jgi:hypothetical protein